ncbi:TonB-dependent siderophore receptor [Salinisphaera sp. Q1T1-3]|uniref:TonB-dependent siderophore receptor n=1 Tax=Salinisphaera sp. Q1T1-3 TaxID=2321229 RepID=UPI000E737A02|nr:TonB-dependent receptor [Salinisphaera sp. Q1T1-3]RJS94101.1 TonB-dependent receptor [Salinisphaera sp. Q1T1-3]
MDRDTGPIPGIGSVSTRFRPPGLPVRSETPSPVGVRYDDFMLRTENEITNVDSERRKGRVSPQAVIVYELSDPATIYTAYGVGFRANTVTDVAGRIFDPEETRSVEAGTTLSFLGGAITGTVAVFQLNKKNVLASDINNPGFSVAIGKARSRGVALDLSGELPARVAFRLSYAYVDAESRSSVQDPNFTFDINPGDPLINIPDHPLNAQAQKRLLVLGRGVMAGAGMQYVGERLGATGTDFTLPDHVLFRVFGEVGLTDNLTAFARLPNPFDTHWYANSYSRLWVQPGAPRTATLGLRASF